MFSCRGTADTGIHRGGQCRLARIVAGSTSCLVVWRRLSGGKAGNREARSGR
jgi:hypothetical protein